MGFLDPLGWHERGRPDPRGLVHGTSALLLKLLALMWLDHQAG